MPCRPCDHIRVDPTAALKVALLMAMSTMLMSQPLAAQETAGQPVTAAPSPVAGEPYNSGWELFIDNDGFFSTDNNYTGGFALTLAGRRAQDHLLSVDGARRAVDRWLGVERLYRGEATVSQHRIELGLVSFTPSDLETPAPLPDDHPYACLVFVNNTGQVVVPARATSYQTTFLAGLLGTNLCEVIQQGLHDLVDADDARGWGNQISDGGEPTFQWGISRQKLLSQRRSADGRMREVSWVTGAQVGFTTGVAVGLDARWGRIHSPWWSFAPHQAEYINLGAPAAAPAKGEFYFWTGGILRLRLYNAILQGQFRDSAVEHEGGRLNRLVGEVWLGATRSLRPGLTGSIVLRARTREIKGAGNTDDPVWLGFTLRRSY